MAKKDENGLLVLPWLLGASLAAIDLAFARPEAPWREALKQSGAVSLGLTFVFIQTGWFRSEGVRQIATVICLLGFVGALVWGGVKVISPSGASAASTISAFVAAVLLLGAAIVAFGIRACPGCGSTDIEVPHQSLGALVPIGPPVWRCNACGKTWQGV